MTVKGRVTRDHSNIKAEAGGSNVIATLGIGDIVYGDLSADKTAIVKIKRIYRVDGTIDELVVVCKADIANMVVTDPAVEPNQPPVPDPVPPVVYKYPERAIWTPILDGVQLPPKYYVIDPNQNP